MESHQCNFTYTVYKDKRSLSSADQSLINEAVMASQKAYAPYSKFKVGAAIRTTDLKVISGANQENGAFPIGQCAERVALYSMVHTEGRKHIETIAIVVDNKNQKSPASPCGSCRQMLNEYRSFQDKPMRLLLSLATGGQVIEINDITDLLPFAFDGLFLGS
jgi:cytidine deaminase